MTLNVKTLSAPLRVRWDLVPDTGGGLSIEKAASVAGELASLRVFFVTLGLSVGGRSDLGGLVGALKSGGSRVTVSVARPDSFPGWEGLAQSDAVDLRADDGESFKALAAVVSGAPASKTPSVSITPSRKNIDRVVEVVTLALEAGIRDFNLPNPDLVNNRDAARDYALDDADREKLKRGLEGALGPYGKGVRLAVHDLFLHQALDLLGLGGRIEYAGCQAGDAIAYIGKAGLVYPCATWPLVLGDLAERPFREIWASAERKALREGLAVPPEGCSTCPEVGVCKGGCRGLAWLLCGPDSKDPNCQRQ